MTHNTNIIVEAKRLRNQGLFFRRNCKQIKIAKSTAHLWVKRVELDEKL